MATHQYHQVTVGLTYITGLPWSDYIFYNNLAFLKYSFNFDIFMQVKQEVGMEVETAATQQITQ